MEENENFIDYFDVYEENNIFVTVKMTYFAFTSISTVGLGDYHPRSNSERIIGAVFMMCGASVTSYVIEAFTSMIDKIQALHKSHEDSNQLSFFLKTLEKFNGD